MTAPVGMTMWTGEILHGLLSRGRPVGGHCLLREGQSVSSRDELPHRHSNLKCSILDTCTPRQSQKQPSAGYIYMCMTIHTHTHPSNINKRPWIWEGCMGGVGGGERGAGVR